MLLNEKQLNSIFFKLQTWYWTRK